ncbi:MAG: hypothetical protein E7632_11660, partial [Ruminococcaceae bacterium]|nr:hypothetical protein [Oscillospiraceae bacterium]
MKYTKQIASLLAALVLLCGCTAAPTEAVPHTTTMTYCRHGNNYYFYGYHSGNFNPALETEVPLCFDPLCSHKEYDEQKKQWYSVCPQNLVDISTTYTSDGRYLYMATRAENADHTDTMKRSVYRFDPENPSDLKLVTTYSTSGALFGAPVYVYDGMIYYTQGVYNEDFIKGGVELLDDQSMVLMRVRTSGGKSEAVLDESFRVDNKFYMDENNYYIINYDGPLTVIERETLAKTEVLCDGRSPSQVYTVDGVTYLFCNDETQTITFETENLITAACVYRYENGVCELLARDVMQPQIMDGALWYIPYEITYYGSHEEFNGRENVMRDFFSQYAGELHRLDLATGEKTVWTNEDPEHDLWL